MAIEVEISKSTDRDWNQRLLAAKLGTVYHTKEYAEFARRVKGWVPLFTKFINGKGDVVSQLLIFKLSKYDRMIQHMFTSSPFAPALFRISKSFSARYKWFYGPVMFDEGYREEVYHLLGKKLLEMDGDTEGSIHPLDGQKTPLDDLGFRKQMWGTFIIDLTQNKEKLWFILDKKAGRKNIERARERGVTITTVQNSSDLKIYHNLLMETRSKLNAELNVDFSAFYQGWEVLRNTGFISLLAWKGETPLAGILVSTFNGYMNEWGVARSEYDAKNRLYAQDLLKWHIIEWGHDNGMRCFDLSGVNPDPANKKEIGIYEYKKKWGGTLFRYSIYQKK